TKIYLGIGNTLARNYRVYDVTKWTKEGTVPFDQRKGQAQLWPNSQSIT
ncbi:21606_t:CDS:2, partial [Racocetra persica]